MIKSKFEEAMQWGRTDFCLLALFVFRINEIKVYALYIKMYDFLRHIKYILYLEKMVICIAKMLGYLIAPNCWVELKKGE